MAELPQERGLRGGGGFHSFANVFAAIAGATAGAKKPIVSPIGAAGASDGATVTTGVDRLEALEHELRQLAAAAPTTWERHRRLLFRVLRQARREMRSRSISLS
jgi:hypothetical protein